MPTTRSTHVALSAARALGVPVMRDPATRRITFVQYARPIGPCRDADDGLVLFGLLRTDLR